MRLFRRRCIELAIAVAAVALLAALPAGALAVGEESGGTSTPGETATEPPASTAEPPSSSGSTGWSPVGTGTGTSSSGASGVRHGSSLGSGGGSEPTRSTAEPKPTASSGDDYVPESSSPSTFEEAPSTAQPESSADSTAPPAADKVADAPDHNPPDKTLDVAVGTATPLTLSEPDPADDVSSAPPVSLASSPSMPSPGREASGSSALPLLVAIVLGLCLYPCWRLGLHLRDRRARRRVQEVRWSREADWEAFVRKIEMGQAPATTSSNGDQLQWSEVEPDVQPIHPGAADQGVYTG